MTPLLVWFLKDLLVSTQDVSAGPKGSLGLYSEYEEPAGFNYLDTTVS